MKSLKLLGIAVASLGIAASVGGAVALYVNGVNNATLGIGAGSYSGRTGKVTYKINGKVSGTVAPKYYTTGDSPTEGPGLSETYSQVKYEFPLSATYANDLVKQNYVHGNISVSITDIPAKYQGKLTIWAGIDGYSKEENHLAGYQMFGNCFGSDVDITNEVQSYVKNADISVTSDGGQSLVVWMKYTALSGSNYLELNEEALGYTLSVSWGAATGEVAYIVGTGNQWTANEDFAMAKNINASKDVNEWCYNSFAADESWSRAKCMKPTGNVWSANPDATLTSGKTYNVYWNGSGESGATFDEVNA